MTHAAEGAPLAPKPPTLDEEEEAFLAAQVEAAVAPYVGKLSPADLSWMRERMLESIREDPDMRMLAQAARPRVADQSGEVFRGPTR